MTTDEHVIATVDAAAKAVVYAATVAATAEKRARYYRRLAWLWFVLACVNFYGWVNK